MLGAGPDQGALRDKAMIFRVWWTYSRVWGGARWLYRRGQKQA